MSLYRRGVAVVFVSLRDVIEIRIDLLPHFYRTAKERLLLYQGTQYINPNLLDGLRMMDDVFMKLSLRS